jgi:cytochrome bd-type quinol oxidase subunit 2
MTLRFNITQEEYSEFTKHFYKKVFTGNWKWYGIIAVIILAINVYTSSTKEHFDGENGEGTSISYTSNLINWVLLLAVFAGAWWFIVRQQLSSKPSSIFNWKFFVLAILVLFGLSTFYSHSDSDNTWASIIPTLINWLLMLTIFGGLWAFIFNRIKKTTNTAQDTEKMLGDREMFIEEAKVQLNTKTTETTYRWDSFIKWEQTPNLYLLFITSKSAILIPKRVFENPQQQLDFETLVKRKMPDSTKMPNLENPNVLDA